MMKINHHHQIKHV